MFLLYNRMSRRPIVFPELPHPLSNVTALGWGKLRLREDEKNGENFTSFKAPDSLSQNLTWVLPDSDGTTGQILSTDGSGNMSWADNGGGLDATVTALEADYVALETYTDTRTQWIYGDGLNFNDGTNWITWTNSYQSSHNAFTWDGNTFSPPADDWYRVQGAIQTRVGAGQDERAVSYRLRDGVGAIAAEVIGQIVTPEGGTNYYYMSVDIRAQLLSASAYHIEMYSVNEDTIDPFRGCFIAKRTM
jgi:hypothetical protein